MCLCVTVKLRATKIDFEWAAFESERERDTAIFNIAAIDDDDDSERVSEREKKKTLRNVSL
jgi:siroheme synthase (precorrin-2 oxidase/ferrochelatase)